MNQKRLKNFSLYFIIALLFSTFLTIFIIVSFSKEPWNIVFFERRFSHLPLFIYLVFFAFIAALIVYAYFNFVERKRTKKIEDALKMLNQGQYSAKIFLNMFSDDTPVQINEKIDQEFLKLHEKMMLISEEAVSVAQQTSSISEETKEEILEKERHRIARELHDSVSQQLFAAAMLLSAIQATEDELPEEIRPQVKLISNIINDAQSEMRALLLHLRPIQLDGKSLKKGIELLLDELKSKVPLTITHDIEDVELTEVVEDHLFRIAQELLSNVLRHAHAKELEVYLKKTDDFYLLRFIDDGDGFDLEEKKASGFGLSNIRERISGIGGNVKIVSFPGQGTSVEVRIPLITGGQR